MLLLMLIVLGTPLRSIPQPSIAEVFPGFSEIRLQWFFGSHGKRGFKNTVACTVMLCSVFAKTQRLCRDCEQSPHPNTGRRRLPESFGSVEQGGGSDGEEKSKSNRRFWRSKRKYFGKILQTSLIQSKEKMRPEGLFQLIVTAWVQTKTAANEYRTGGSQQHTYDMSQCW